jgi:hypothetical protein
MSKKKKFINVGNGVSINADLVDEIRKDRIILNNGEVIFINEFDKVPNYRDDLYGIKGDIYDR